MKTEEQPKGILVNVDSSLVEFARLTPISEKEFGDNKRCMKKANDKKQVFVLACATIVTLGLFACVGIAALGIFEFVTH